MITRRGIILLLSLLLLMPREGKGEERYPHWLVQFSLPVTLDTTLLSDLEKRLGIRIRNAPIPLPKTFQFSFSLPLLRGEVERWLSLLGPIAILEPNRPIRPLRTSNDPLYRYQWGLKNTGQILPAFPDPADNQSGETDPGTAGIDIGAESAWELTTGTSELRIGVIDTGVDRNHPDLKNHIFVNPREIANNLDDDGNGYVDDLYGWDYCDGDGDPEDLDGHGTAVAGTLLASGEDGIGISGVMWKGIIVPVRFLGPTFSKGADPDLPDCNLTSGAIKGLDYLKNQGVRVVNMSWGGDEDSTLLRQKIQELIGAGIVLVAASGNDGADLSSKPMYPASYSLDGLIVVGAFTNDGKIASFSNYGPTVKVYAPGVNIYAPSPAREDYWNYRNFNATPRPSGVERLFPGRITGTDFSIAGSNPQFGKARLTSGDIAILGDVTAVKNYINNQSPQGYTGGVSGVLLADPVDLRSFGKAILHYTLFYEFDSQATLVLEYSRENGPWQRLPDGVGVYGDTQGEPKVVEETLDFQSALGGTIPSSLMIRFLFTTRGAKNTANRIPGGFWLTGVSWLRAGNRYDGTQGAPYDWYSGTSLSAPFISGAAGLILSLFPDLRPADTHARIQTYGSTLSDPKGKSVLRLYLPAVLSGGPIVSGLEEMGGSFGISPSTITLGESVTFRLRILSAPPPVSATALWGIREFTSTPLVASGEGELYTAVVTPPEPGTYRYTFRVTTAGTDLHGPFEEERNFYVLPPPSPLSSPSPGCSCSFYPGPAHGDSIIGLLFLLFFLCLRHGSRRP